MNIYQPTWLYIKQHNQTGLKYFGKTTQNPYTYKGSGKHWKRHLRKHGNDVTTIWCQLFETEEEIVAYALSFSKENNIVESSDWANLVIENGLDGGDRYSFLPKEHQKEISRKLSIASSARQHSEETKKKISESHKGNTWGFKKGNLGRTGQKQSIEERKKKSIAMTLVQANLTEEQKIHRSERLSKAMTGKKHSKEHIENLRKSRCGKSTKLKGRKFTDTERWIQIAKNRPRASCIFCHREFSISSFTRYHGDKCKNKPK